MNDKIGPKERMLREQREQRFATKGAGKKASASELRQKIATINPVKKPAKGKERRP